MVKAYIRLDKVGASDHYETVTSLEALQNGQFVDLGAAIEDGEGEAVAITKTATGKAPDAILTSVFVDKGYPDFDITKQEVKPGKAARALVIKKGQMVSLNKEICGEAKKGDDVAVAVNGLGLKKAELEEIVIGKVIREDYLEFIGDLLVVRFN